MLQTKSLPPSVLEIDVRASCTTNALSTQFRLCGLFSSGLLDGSPHPSAAKSLLCGAYKPSIEPALPHLCRSLKKVPHSCNLSSISSKSLPDICPSANMLSK